MFLLVMLAVGCCHAKTNFGFSTDPTITSWEFQMDTPANVTTVDYYTTLALALYDQFAATKSNEFEVKHTTSKATFGYRKIMITKNNQRAALVYIKERKWQTGDRANTTDITVKFQHVPSAATFVPLTNMLPTIETKLENDVHCLYNGCSYSVMNPNVTRSAADGITTLADLLPLISPDLATYLNLSTSTPVTPFCTGEGIEDTSNVEFNHKSKVFPSIKAGSTMEYTDDIFPSGSNVIGQELSIRVKREKANGDVAGLNASLNVATALFNFLAANGTLNQGSCDTTPPPMGRFV